MTNIITLLSKTKELHQMKLFKAGSAILVLIVLFLFIDIASSYSKPKPEALEQITPTEIPTPTEIIKQAQPTRTPTPTPPVPSYTIPTLTTKTPMFGENEIQLSYIRNGEVWISNMDGTNEQQVTFSEGKIALHEWGSDEHTLYVTYSQLLEDSYADFTVNHGLIEVNLATGIQKTIIEPIQDPRYFYHLCDGLIHYPSITVLTKSPDNNKLAISKSGLQIYEFDKGTLETIHEIPNSFHFVEKEKGLLSLLVKPAYAACVSDPRYINFEWSPNSQKIIARLGKWESSEIHLITLGENANYDYQELAVNPLYSKYLFDFFTDDIFVGINTENSDPIQYYTDTLDHDSEQTLWANDQDDGVFYLDTYAKDIFAYTRNNPLNDLRPYSIYKYDYDDASFTYITSLEDSVQKINNIAELILKPRDEGNFVFAFWYDWFDSGTRTLRHKLHLHNTTDTKAIVILDEASNPKFR